MADVIFDPEKETAVPLMSSQPSRDQKTINGVVYQMEGIGYPKQCMKIVREKCERLNLPLAAVPVVHRGAGAKYGVRFWDVRPNADGAGHFCISLCSTEWRFATTDEVDAYHNGVRSAQESDLERRQSEAAMEMVTTAGVKQIFETAAATKEAHKKAELEKESDADPFEGVSDDGLRKLAADNGVNLGNTVARAKIVHKLLDGGVKPQPK